MPNRTVKPVWLTLAPLIFLLLWSGGYATAKVGLQYSGPMTLLVIRYGLVVAIMLVAFAIIRPSVPERKIDWLHLAVVGFFLQSVYFGFCYIAFDAGIGAGTLALMMSLQPILVGILAPGWSNEHISWKRWVGLILGLAGTAIVIISRSDIEPPSFLGMATAIIGLGGITAASLWEKRFGVSHHPVTANLVGFGAGLLGVLPMAFLMESRPGSWNLLASVDWTWEFSAVVFYLVVGNSVIAVGLLLAMIRAGEVSRVSALFFLVPPLAAIIAWVLLGEVVPLIAWPGICIAAVGVYIATR